MQARGRLALAWLAVAMLLSPVVAEEKVLHDGSRYEGEVNHAGDPHGWGVKTWFDGSRYEGEFRDGKLHGQGVYTSPDGYRVTCFSGEPCPATP